MAKTLPLATAPCGPRSSTYIGSNRTTCERIVYRADPEADAPGSEVLLGMGVSQNYASQVTRLWMNSQ